MQLINLRQRVADRARPPLVIVPVGLAEVAGRNRLVPMDHELVAAARGLGVCLGDF